MLPRSAARALAVGGLLLLAVAPVRADRRFPPGTPKEVVETILRTEAEAGRYVGCRSRVRLARRNETPWLMDALAQLGHGHRLVRLAALDLLLAGVRDGLIDADAARTTVLPALEGAKAHLAGDDERMRASRIAFAARMRSLPPDAALAEMETVLFGRGQENWSRALESLLLLGERNDEQAAALLARRLEKEQNQGSDLAHRLREARAKVDLRRKTAALDDQWDRALLLYGAVVGAEHAVPASHLACALLGLMEEQGNAAARAFLKQLVDDPNHGAALHRQASEALARLAG